MKNDVPNAVSSPSREQQTVERGLQARQAAYREEVRRLMEAGLQAMRETGRIDPRVSEIVRAAGLSNQAFYRHFRSKDELLLAILDDGQRSLVAYLEHRMARARDPLARIRSWIDGVLAQALDPEAASATRPFAVHSARLAERFPEDTARSHGMLKEPLVRAVAEARQAGALPEADPERDADAIYHLAMGWMQRQLVSGATPSRDDADHLCSFAMRGLRPGTLGKDPRGA